MSCGKWKGELWGEGECRVIGKGGYGGPVGREEWCAMQSLWLAELAQHLVDRVERCVYILPHLHMQTGTSVWAMASELVSKK